jgi:hypothetical protein
LHDAVRKGYIEGWNVVAREVARLARVPPSELAFHALGRDAAETTENLVYGLPWERVYDLWERIHGYLAKEVGRFDQDQRYNVDVSRGNVQAEIASELRRLFLEEGLAFEFDDGVVRRRGRRYSVERISRAEVVLGDPRLTEARKHYEKALRFFRDRDSPDHENAVKEAVCAVEAAAKSLFSDANTLGDFVKWITGTQATALPKSLGQTIAGLYGFRSGGIGVGHGGASGGVVTAELAEYVLAVSASQTILLAEHQEVPS